MSKTKQTKKATQPTKDAENYIVSLDYGGNIQEVSGKTVLEAFKKVTLPIKNTHKAILTVTKGNKSYEQMLQPSRIKQMFSKHSDIAKNVWIKTFSPKFE